MKYVASSEQVENLTVDKNGLISFDLNGVNYATEQAPEISQDGAPAECYYEQKLAGGAGVLKYDIVNQEAEDDSEACDWDKFDVYLY